MLVWDYNKPIQRKLKQIIKTHSKSTKYWRIKFKNKNLKKFKKPNIYTYINNWGARAWVLNTFKPFQQSLGARAYHLKPACLGVLVFIFLIFKGLPLLFVKKKRKKEVGKSRCYFFSIHFYLKTHLKIHLEQKNKLIYQSKKPKNLPKIKANFLSLSLLAPIYFWWK